MPAWISLSLNFPSIAMTSVIKGSNNAEGYSRIGRTKGICATLFTCLSTH